jgi:hypothetical protein
MSHSTARPSEMYCPRFGQLAVAMGYVTPEQLKQALSEQIDDNLNDRSHRVLGTIFFEHGWMSPGQVDQVLNKLFKMIGELEQV